jgi:hypothetical protein
VGSIEDGRLKLVVDALGLRASLRLDDGYLSRYVALLCWSKELRGMSFDAPCSAAARNGDGRSLIYRRIEALSVISLTRNRPYKGEKLIFTPVHGWKPY